MLRSSVPVLGVARCTPLCKELLHSSYDAHHIGKEERRGPCGLVGKHGGMIQANDVGQADEVRLKVRAAQDLNHMCTLWDGRRAAHSTQHVGLSEATAATEITCRIPTERNLTTPIIELLSARLWRKPPMRTEIWTAAPILCTDIHRKVPYLLPVAASLPGAAVC